jgi:RNA polymerase sigma-70 factor, ECF subfamily
MRVASGDKSTGQEAEHTMTDACPPPLPSLPLGGGGSGGWELSSPGDPCREIEAMITKLYRDNGAFVLSYVIGLLNDRYLAEDVLQETMERAWRHCGEFSAEKGSVRGWLMRVAHNIAMDKVRMRRSRPTEVAEDAAPEALVEDHADAVLTSLHIQHALARLSPGHRDVLEQVYLHGCTAREAAARLGIPEGTAYSRSHYALRILRRELGATPATRASSAAA